MNRTRLIAILALTLTVFCALIFSRRDEQRSGAASIASQQEMAPFELTPRLASTASPEFLPIRASTDGQTYSAKIEQPVRDPRNRWHNPAKVVEVSFPRNFSEAVRVRCGVADVAARPVGGSATSCAETNADGSLIYRDAFPGCDVQYKSSLYKTEEFIIVRDKSALLDPENEIAEWSWQLDLGSGDNRLKPRLTPAHTIELCDNAGVPRLRINAPDGKDADGRALRAGKELRYAIDGARLTCQAELKGCAYPVVVDPTWTTTGAMANTRYSHVSMKLNDGRVIVFGGLYGGGISNVCEIYDPATKVWSATGNLQVAREPCTGVLNTDGSVSLFGTDPSGTDATCEIFDPVLFTWSLRGTLNTARRYPTSTLLSNGKILVAGGYSGASAQDTCELYDPVTGGSVNTDAMTIPRQNHAAIRLNNGNVLVMGGSGAAGGTCEIYDVASQMWASTGAMNSTDRDFVTAGIFQNGQVLSVGGYTGPDSGNSVAEIFNPATGVWTVAANAPGASFNATTAIVGGKIYVSGGLGNLNNSVLFAPDGTAIDFGSFEGGVYPEAPGTFFPRGRNRHTMTLLADGTVLIAGGVIYGGLLQASCRIFDPRPIPGAVATETLATVPVGIALSANAVYQPVTYAIVASPTHGVLSGTPPNLVYTPDAGYIGPDSFTFTANDGALVSAITTASINVVNGLPSVSAAASPAVVNIGSGIFFSATGTDPDGGALTYSWDFGDGSSAAGQNPAHTYGSPGTYTATVTVTDQFAASSSASVTVHVGRTPVARFTTSDVVGFVGLPLTFDAALSTDLENDIVGYLWNFGDGTPNGSKQVLSKIYSAPGSYAVSLTITDGEGLSATTTRNIEILPADQIGLFNSSLEYKVKWDRGKEDADTLALVAEVNMGDAVIGAETPVAVEIAGVRFEAVLDLKLRAKTLNESWQVKANTRSQAAGEVALKFKAKKASLGLGFNQLGAVGEGEVVTLDIPVRLEIAGRVFEVLLDSDFKFSKDGKKAAGEGEGP
jgi:PKD repeat protein